MSWALIQIRQVARPLRALSQPWADKSGDQIAASMAAAKLEDGDIKGAVRLQYSDDSLAVPDGATFAELVRLQPTAPYAVDRRPATSSVTQPLQVLPQQLERPLHSSRMDQPQDQMV